MLSAAPSAPSAVNGQSGGWTVGALRPPAESVRAAVARMVRAALENAGQAKSTSFREATFPCLRHSQPLVLSELRRLKLGFQLGSSGVSGELWLTLFGDQRVEAAFRRLTTENAENTEQEISNLRSERPERTAGATERAPGQAAVLTSAPSVSSVVNPEGDAGADGAHPGGGA